MTTLQLKQCNTIFNQYLKMLDLVITNQECRVLKVTCPLVPEDFHHPAFFVNATIVSTHRFLTSSFYNNVDISQTNSIYNFKKADYQALYAYIFDMDWSCLSFVTDPNEACYEFSSKLNYAFSLFVPKRSNNAEFSRRYPPWFDHHIINDINLKHKLLKKRSKSTSKYYEDQIKNLSESIRKNIKHAYYVYIRTTECNLKYNPKNFWKFFNNHKPCVQIPDVMYLDDLKLTNQQDIVNEFSNLFSTHCRSSTTSLPTTVNNVHVDNFCNTPFLLSSVTVLNAIKN